jgi:hypothetical protein
MVVNAILILFLCFNQALQMSYFVIKDVTTNSTDQFIISNVHTVSLYSQVIVCTNLIIYTVKVMQYTYVIVLAMIMCKSDQQGHWEFV